MSTVSRWLSSRRLDVDAAALGLLAALALFPLRFLASQIYIETLPIVLGLGCLLYLLAARANRAATPPALAPAFGRVLSALSFVGIGAVPALAAATGGRTPAVYAAAGVTGGLLFLQVLFVGDREFAPGRALAQVVLFAVAIRFAALFTSPGFVGIDIWTHQRLAGAVLEQRTLAAIADNKHFAAPLYHLLVVTTAMVADVSLRTALYLSLGVAVPVATAFVYATTRLLVAERWAVLAALLYAVGDYVVEWGIHLIPTSMGLALFLGVVYAMVRLMRSRRGARDFALLAALSVLVVLTHQVSSFIMLVMVGSGIVAQVALRLPPFRDRSPSFDLFQSVSPVNLLGLGVFDLGLITFMWSLTPYKGDTFLETVLSYLRETLASSAGFLNLAGGTGSTAEGGGAASQSAMAALVTYVDTLGFLVLFCATVVGCLYVVHRERASHAPATLLIATVCMLVFVLGLPLFGIRNFIPQRWFAFLYAPMAVLAAVGVRHLSRNLHRGVLVAVLVVFSLVYPGAMVLSTNGAIDNPAFPDERARLSYTEQELAAVETIGAMTGSPDSETLRPGQVIRTDHPYQTVFDRTGAYPAEPAKVVEGQPVTHDVTVYREYQSTSASFFLGPNDNGRIRDVPRSRLCAHRSTLYDNGDVSMCATG